MAFTKIGSADTADKGVVGMPDKPDLTTLQMQNKLDELALSVIIPKHNALIDELEAGTAGASIGVKNGTEDTTLQSRLDAIAAGGYTKTEADEKFLAIDDAAETYLTLEDAADTYYTQESAETDLAGKADTSDIPTKVSDLTNDSGFITEADIPTKTSDLTNDSGFITSASVDSLTDTNISSPSNGQVLKYDSTSSKWVNGTGGGGGASDLNDLSDVTITSPTTSQVLTYDGSKWTNSNSSARTVLNDLDDVTLSSSSNGQVLTYDSTSAKWKNETPSMSVSGLTDTSISSMTIADGQPLTYNSTSQKWENKSLPTASTSQAGIVRLSSDYTDTYTDRAPSCYALDAVVGIAYGTRVTSTISSGTTVTFTDNKIDSNSVLDLYVDSTTPVNFESISVSSHTATVTLSEAVSSSTTFMLIVR